MYSVADIFICLYCRGPQGKAQSYPLQYKFLCKDEGRSYTVCCVHMALIF